MNVLELVVVVLVMAVVASLMVAAVARVRNSALMVESENNLRQIALAVHLCSDSHGGLLPICPVSEKRGNLALPVDWAPSVLVSLMPYCEQTWSDPLVRPGLLRSTPVTLFLSPADPTSAAAIADKIGVSSYAANAEVFKGHAHSRPRLPQTFADGMSNTIIFAEHYAYKCGGESFLYSYNGIRSGLYHRPTFADVQDLSPGRNGIGGFPSWTFQTAPSLSTCISVMAQTPHAQGMITAWGDGSIHVLSPSISPLVYWSAVTPAGGEAVELEW